MAVSERRCAVTWRNELWKMGGWIIKTYSALHKKYLTLSTSATSQKSTLDGWTRKGVYSEYYTLFSWFDHAIFQSEPLILMHVRPRSDRVDILWISNYTAYKRINTELYSNVFLVQQTIDSQLPYLLTIHVWSKNHQFKKSVITDDFDFIFNFHLRKMFKLRNPIIVTFTSFSWVVKMLSRLTYTKYCM